MEKQLSFGHYQITVRCVDGYLVQICNTETNEVWESGPHHSKTEAVNQCDKGLLLYFEAFDSRDSAERQNFRQEISLLLNQVNPV